MGEDGSEGVKPRNGVEKVVERVVGHNSAKSEEEKNIKSWLVKITKSK